MVILIRLDFGLDRLTFDNRLKCKTNSFLGRRSSSASSILYPILLLAGVAAAVGENSANQNASAIAGGR